MIGKLPAAACFVYRLLCAWGLFCLCELFVSFNFLVFQEAGPQGAPGSLLLVFAVVCSSPFERSLPVPATGDHTAQVLLKGNFLRCFEDKEPCI